MQRLVKLVMSSIMPIWEIEMFIFNLWKLMASMLLLVLAVRSFEHSFSIMDTFFCVRNEDGLIELALLFKHFAPSTERLPARRWFGKTLEAYVMDTSLDLRLRQL
jgi:hypothetical protein